MTARLIMVIILKYIEILNHYLVYQELTVLQVSYTSKPTNQTNKQTDKKGDQICRYQRWWVGGGEIG